MSANDKLILCVCLCESSPLLHLRCSPLLLLCSRSFRQSKRRKGAPSSVSDCQGDNSTQNKTTAFLRLCEFVYVKLAFYKKEGFHWLCQHFHACRLFSIVHFRIVVLMPARRSTDSQIHHTEMPVVF